MKLLRSILFATLPACHVWFTMFLFLPIAGCTVDHPFIQNNFDPATVPEADEKFILHTIFLVGDAGDPQPVEREPVLAALQEQASKVGEKGTVVVLGDNIYPAGMPEKGAQDRTEAEQRLAVQLRAIERSGASGIILPGNHDWNKWDEGGLQSILRQQAFVDSFSYRKTTFLPRDGTPGPAFVDVNERIRIVILDTQWWLQEEEKSFYPNSYTESDTKGKFLDSLAFLLTTAENRHVVIVGHHPLETYGPHGGFFDWKDHVFPLRKLHPSLWIPIPVLGSFYPLARTLGISSQDLSSSRYRDFKKSLERVFSQHPPLLYATGHEHSLQILKGVSSIIYAISGYGSSVHESPLTSGPNTLFAHDHSGFMRLDFLNNGAVRLGVIEPIYDDGATNEVFSFWLVQPN